MKVIVSLALIIAIILTLFIVNEHKFTLLNCIFNNKDKSTKVQTTSRIPSISDTIIDSNQNFKQLTNQSEAPSFVIDSLVLLNVNYLGFDNKIHKGQLIVNKKCQNSAKSIFIELLKIRFPIFSVKPISYFGWNDSLSMAHNNTSSYNYRTVDGTYRLSHHAYGLAIDINPFLNPFIKGKKYSRPINAIYDVKKPGTMEINSEAVNIFKKHGWKWGGDFRGMKDYQHFYY